MNLLAWHTRARIRGYAVLKVATRALAAACVVGCASSPPEPPRAWYKDGATRRDFDVDSARCRLMARGLTLAPRTQAFNSLDAAGVAVQNAGADLQDMADELSTFYDCMTAKRWVYR